MIDSNEGGMGVQSAVIRPERSRLFAAVAGLLVLTGLMAFFPSACVGLALLTPLLGCPLAGVRPAMGRLAGRSGSRRPVLALSF